MAAGLSWPYDVVGSGWVWGCGGMRGEGVGSQAALWTPPPICRCGAFTHHAVGLVEALPDDAAPAKVRRRGGGEAAKAGDARRRVAPRARRVARVGVVEDPVRAHARGRQRRQQAVVRGEVIRAAGALDRRPREVHARDAERGRQQRHLARLRVGPVDVGAPAVAHPRRRRGRGGGRDKRGGEQAAARHCGAWFSWWLKCAVERRALGRALGRALCTCSLQLQGKATKRMLDACARL